MEGNQKATREHAYTTHKGSCQPPGSNAKPSCHDSANLTPNTMRSEEKKESTTLCELIKKEEESCAN